MQFPRLQHLIILLVLTSSLSAQEKDKNKWTPSDIINTEFMSSIKISPDNKMVAWTKRRGDKEKDKFVSDIYLTKLDVLKDGKPLTLQMTTSDENDNSPIFSRDSETLYFLSSREEGKKLWAMSVHGGEPKEVHEFKNGISNIQWMSDSTFSFISNEGKTLYEQELKKKKDNVIVVEDEEHWTKNRIYQFDLKKKTSKRLTENAFPVSRYTASPDGKWIVYRQTLSRHFAADQQPHPNHFLLNVSTGNTKQIFQDLNEPGNAVFTKSGNGFYFTTIHTSLPKWQAAGATNVHYYDLSSGRHSQVDLDWKWDTEGNFEVIGEDLLVALANGPSSKLAFYRKNGSSWTKSDINTGTKEGNTWLLAASEDGSKVVYEHSSASKLPVYYITDAKSNGNRLSLNNEVEISKLNKKLSSKPITKSEIFKWKGYNDEEVTGILYYPENYEAGKKYPLMLSIHGGPTASDFDRWRERWSTYPQIIAQRGAFVLKPNYHGSSHHGKEFVESIFGKYYDPEMIDLITGIDALVEKGLVDRNELGTMGWSNGAILSTMLTIRYPDMFKVVCPGAGDVNWTSDYGTCRFGVSFDQTYLKGAPWDDVDGKTYNELYITKSPLFEMEKMTTPTIIFHGSEDRSVPRDQGWEYYRSIQQIGIAPVKFLWFPGQPHGLQKITHQMRKMEEELKWIDKYFFEKEDDANEAFKDDSPLAMLIKKAKAKMHEGHYGVYKNGMLIPEVAAIKKDSISIGIFEVTREQFRNFNSNYSFAPSAGNKPAQVSLSQANSYAKWLSEKTGENYRLPNARESKSLHEKAYKAAAKENTLNHLAGYDITWDEVEELRKKITEVEGGLISDVGNFPPVKVGEAEVFDLGGNVSEHSANGSKYGFGAIDFVDPNSDQPTQDKKYVGFRVIRE